MPFELTPSQTASIDLMKKRLSGFETEEGRLSGLAFKPIPTDVIITTSPKAGTTWMQQICHQLRTGGDMDFEEISEVVPWFELAVDQGQDLLLPQKAEPRVFKTHAWRNHCPKGGRYIAIVRDPADVALSFYNFFEGWFFEPGEVELEPFVREFWLARGRPLDDDRMTNASFYDHFLSWWEVRERDDVLFLFFEDLKENLPTQIAKVAKFMQLKNADDPELIKRVTEMGGYQFMKQHSYHFDEKLSKLARNKACGLTPDAGMGKSKIRDGKAGSAKHTLSDELVKDIDARWTTQMLPATGYESYAALRRSWHEREKEKAR